MILKMAFLIIIDHEQKGPSYKKGLSSHGATWLGVMPGYSRGQFQACHTTKPVATISTTLTNR